MPLAGSILNRSGMTEMIASLPPKPGTIPKKRPMGTAIESQSRSVGEETNTHSASINCSSRLPEPSLFTKVLATMPAKASPWCRKLRTPASTADPSWKSIGKPCLAASASRSGSDKA